MIQEWILVIKIAIEESVMANGDEHQVKSGVFVKLKLTKLI